MPFWQDLMMNAFEVLQRPMIGFVEAPDLTIVVPTSNTEAYLPACLASVTNQCDLRIELIVVDFESTDRSLEVVREFGQRHADIALTVVRQNTPGLGDARNIGLQLASGEFIAFLDSDDFFTPDSYTAMVQFARAQSCDLVLCRAMVFDDLTHETHLFYDDWIWDELLGASETLITRAALAPQLLRLEPNASLRIMRRGFMLERNISYPENRRAEDMVPHYRSLFEAARIGLLSRMGFFYRVGRAGKLTNDPAKWIGDLLEAAFHAVSEANHYGVDAEAGAAMLYLCVRALFGYGTQLPYVARANYYRNASLLFAQVPNSWVRRALLRPMHPRPADNVRMTVALQALQRRDVACLVSLSGVGRSVIGLALLLAPRPSLLVPFLRHYRRAMLRPSRWADVWRSLFHA